MDKPKEKSKLKIRIESRTSALSSSVSKGQTASYLDMKNSPGTWAHSVLSMAESKSSDINICNQVLATVKRAFHSDYFSDMKEGDPDSEYFHAKTTGLFTDINSELVALRNQGINSECSLCFSMQRRNNLYIALSGSINILLIRDKIIYSLLAKDKIFAEINVNPYKKNTSSITLGSSIIPVVNTYRLQIEPGDTVFIVSEGVTNALTPKKILTGFVKPGGFDKNFSDLADRAGAKNPDRNVSIIALAAESIDSAQTTKPLFAHQLLKSIVLKKNKTIAELPPIFPPLISDSEELEIKRDKRDYFNTSGGTPLIERGEEIPESLKMAIGVLAVLLTVTIGVFLFSEYFCFSSPVYNANWSFRSTARLSALIWNKIQVPPEEMSDYKFNYRSDKKGELEILSSESLCNADLTVYSGVPISVQSSQSINSITENQITLEKDRVLINTNLCTTVDRIVISDRTVDPEGDDYYKMSLKINRIKGPIRVICAPMRSLREINLSLSPAKDSKKVKK